MAPANQSDKKPLMTSPEKAVKFDDQANGPDAYTTPSKDKKVPTPSFRSNQRSMQDEIAYQDEIKNIVNSAMRSYSKKTGQSPDLNQVTPPKKKPSPRSIHRDSLAGITGGQAYRQQLSSSKGKYTTPKPARTQKQERAYSMAKEKVQFLSSQKTGYNQAKVDQLEAQLDAEPEYLDYVKRNRGLTDYNPLKNKWTPKRPRDIPNSYQVASSDVVEDVAGHKRALYEDFVQTSHERRASYIFGDKYEVQPESTPVQALITDFSRMPEKEYKKTQAHIERLKKLSSDPTILRSEKKKTNPLILSKRSLLGKIGHPHYGQNWEEKFDEGFSVNRNQTMVI